LNICERFSKPNNKFAEMFRKAGKLNAQRLRRQQKLFKHKNLRIGTFAILLKETNYHFSFVQLFAYVPAAI